MFCRLSFSPISVVATLLVIPFVCCQFYWTQDSMFNNFKANVTDSVSGYVNASTTIVCAIACSNQTWCNSFFFNRDSGMCSLQSLIFSWHQNLSVVLSPSERYYYFNNERCQRKNAFNYDRMSGLCWTLSLTKAIWTDANSSCSNQNLSLLSLTTRAKKDIVIRSFNADPALRLLTETDRRFHIGAHRPLPWLSARWPNGIPDYYWMTGDFVNTTIEREYWAAGQPANDYKGEYTLVLFWTSAQKFEMLDRSGVDMIFSICEKKLNVFV